MEYVLNMLRLLAESCPTLRAELWLQQIGWQHLPQTWLKHGGFHKWRYPKIDVFF